MSRPRRCRGAAARRGSRSSALVALWSSAGAVWLGCAAGSRSATSRAAPHTRTTRCPSCCSPCCSACFAVALGAAVVHVVRHRLVASIALFLFWFLVGGTYWMFNGGVARWLRRCRPSRCSSRPGRARPTRRRFPSTLAALRPRGVPGLLGPAGRVAGAWRHGTTCTWSALTLLAVAVAVPGRCAGAGCSRRGALLAVLRRADAADGDSVRRAGVLLLAGVVLARRWSAARRRTTATARWPWRRR